jgi:hypothetical protein
MAPAIRIDTLVYGPVTPEQALHLLEQRRIADRQETRPAPSTTSAGARS